MPAGSKKGERRGGRKKGAVNKVTSEQREFLKSILDDNRERLKKELKKMEGKAYIDAYLKLMEFTIPRLKAVDMTSKGDQITMTQQPIQISLHSGAKSLNKDNE